MSLILSAEEFIPPAQDKVFVLFCQTNRFAQLVRSETVVHRQAHGIEPQFTITAGLDDVNVRGLLSILRIKNKLIPLDAEDGGHKIPWRYGCGAVSGRGLRGTYSR
jgi:hypothetical protein